MAEPLLELQGVSMAFGGLEVVDDLDLHVDEGEIVSVIGPNGAGKTTLFNLDHRRLRADGGDIRLRRREHHRASQPHKITRLGDRPHVPDAAALPEHVGARERDGRRLRAHEGRRVPLDAAHARACAREERGDPRRSPRSSSSFFGERLMGYRWDQPAYSLSYANRRRLEIARATATEPADPAARRARRRDEPERDARDHRADRAAPHRGRLHDPRDRARHARRRGHLRPRDRARPRRQDRRGHVRAGRDRPARRRGVPRARRRRRPSERRLQPLLKLEGINTYYGQIHILQDVEHRGRARASSSACSAATPPASRRR